MLTTLMAFAWPEIGKIPSGDHAREIAESPNFDPATNRFVNRRQVEYDQMLNNFDYRALMKEQLFGRQVRVPKHPLPQVVPAFHNWASEQSLVYHWLGHSTILARLDNITLLLDPVFTNAAPVPLAVRRFQKPVVPLDGLPEIDVILISHDHYDHLDRASIRHFVDKQTRFIVPLGVSSYLIGWGIASERITELDWWDEIEVQGVTIACTPSQHFSGRTGPRGNKTLWASWSVLGQKERLYFSGDSGYDIHFQEIGKRYGPFDIAFMESGQYNPIWPMSHMFPKETVLASQDLNAKKVQPIHWGMFSLSTHDWFEPAELVWQFGEEFDVTVVFPKIGQAVVVGQAVENERWWR